VVNGYAEVGGEDNKTITALLPHAGLTAFGDEMAGECRGGIYIEDASAVYTVNGGQCYKHISDGTWTSLGAIGGSGFVRFVQNDAPTPQTVALTSSAPFLIESGGLQYLDYDFSPIDVAFHKGRFVYPLADGTFWWTGINSTDVDGLAFASAEADPDGLVACASLDDLYLIGTKTTEIWTVTTSDDLPFQKVGGTFLRIGCAAKATVQEFNNALAWVGHDHVVYAVRGYTSTPISNNEVSRLIQNDPNRSGLVAWTYQIGENKFYCLKGTDWCREYNAKTGFWVNRESGIGDRWRVQHSFEAFGKTIFGDGLTGKLFVAEGYEEDGEELLWGFDTPIVHSTPDGLVFNSIALDMQGGVGDNTTLDPKVMLSWSDDEGANFTPERQISLGAKGKRNTRVVSRRLGRCGPKGRTFRVMISDPVGRSISSIDVKAEPVPLS
jgi:hypothetical protein